MLLRVCREFPSLFGFYFPFKVTGILDPNLEQDDTAEDGVKYFPCTSLPRRCSPQEILSAHTGAVNRYADSRGGRGVAFMWHLL